jgi:hypothetical protein
MLTAETSSPKGTAMSGMASKWFWMSSIIFRSPNSSLVVPEMFFSGFALLN